MADLMNAAGEISMMMSSEFSLESMTFSSMMGGMNTVQNALRRIAENDPTYTETR
jgi:hypothetical protein